MADDFSLVSAAAIARAGSRTLSRAATPQTNPSTLIPGETPGVRAPASAPTANATRISDPRAAATLDVSRARTMIRSAIIAADQILDALDGLARSVGVAAQSSLTSGTIGLQPGGTRVSGLNIQAAAGRTVQAIDQLVDSVGINGVNLISGNSRTIRVQTSQFGGQLTIAPQPLDSASLGIADLATISREDATDALGRIEDARRAVLSRLQTLESIERALTGGGADRNIARVLQGGDGLTSRGSLVDLSV
ncbi:MAG: hypothetical protein RIC16_10370 [Rhodospirillales bacterium]